MARKVQPRRRTFSSCLLMLSFWAWGDDEAETMANLDRVLENLSLALHGVAFED